MPSTTLKKSAYLALAIVAVHPAEAQTALSEGAFVMIGKAYDIDTNRFSDNVPEGEKTVCFQITSIGETEIALQHISGSYRPWWSDKTFAPGTYNDVWFSSTAYLENNPGTDPLGELKQILKPVAACP